MSNTENIIFTAMCLWEHCLHEEPPIYVSYRQNNGACETRDRVRDLAEHCHNAWEHAYEHLGFDAPFDWEWVPAWFDTCVDADLQPVVLTAPTQAQMVMERINGKV